MYLARPSVLSSVLLPVFFHGSAAAPTGHPSHSRCPPFDGNFTIEAYQLYPENGDFDYNHCILYIGDLWNASVSIYDPYKETLETIDFPGITHNPDYHIGGVQYNHQTNLLSVVVDWGNAFNSFGQDISGTNYVILWDPKTRRELYRHNLTKITQGKYGAFQDLEQDPDNNVYVVGTYPSSILRVNAKGNKIETWYLDDNLDHTLYGYGGLAANGWTLITGDQVSGNLYRFDMRAAKGTPVQIPVTPPHTLTGQDAIHFPRRYNGKVLVVTENRKGASIFRSKDGKWKSAEYLGLVPWTVPNIITTASLQIGDAVYFDLMPLDEGVHGPGTAGNRTDFLYVDITDQIDALLEK